MPAIDQGKSTRLRLSMRMLLLLIAAVSVLLWFGKANRFDTTIETFLAILLASTIVYASTKCSQSTRDKINFFTILTVATVQGAICALAIAVVYRHKMLAGLRASVMEECAGPTILIGAMLGAYLSFKFERQLHVNS